MEHERMDEVVLLNEAGEPERFVHILTFLYEKERYVALSPVIEGDAAAGDALQGNEADADEAEVILLRVEEKGDEETYTTIQSEVLLHEVFDHFLELMDEIDEAGE